MTRLWWPLALVILSGCTVNVDGAPIKALLPAVAAGIAAHQAQAGLAGTAPGNATLPASLGTCANGATPAAGTMLGSTMMGDYAGLALPASFTSYQAEQDVTDRISGFSSDASPQGIATWTNFQCLFSQAVTVWNKKRRGAAPVPQAMSTPPPPPEVMLAPPPEAIATPACDPNIEPANGTTQGTAAMGSYEGALLPGSFSAFDSEGAVSDRISAFANDPSPVGVATWVKFQCFYGRAVAVWRERQVTI